MSRALGFRLVAPSVRLCKSHKFQRLARVGRRAGVLQHAPDDPQSCCCTVSRHRSRTSVSSDTPRFLSAARRRGCDHKAALKASRLLDEIPYNDLRRMVSTTCEHRGAGVRTPGALNGAFVFTGVAYPHSSGAQLFGNLRRLIFLLDYDEL
jgi:hypothetical protein